MTVKSVTDAEDSGESATVSLTVVCSSSLNIPTTNNTGVLRADGSTVPALPPMRLPNPNANPKTKTHAHPNPIFNPNPTPEYRST